MKKLIAFLYVGILAFSLTACGGSAKKLAESTPAVSSSRVSTPPETTPEAPKPSTPSPTPEEPKDPEPSPTPEAPKTSSESKISTYDEAKQAILDSVDVAYTGLTSTDAPMYFLASSNGEFVVLVLENADKQRYIEFIGSAVINNDSGIVTVTDDEKGYTFSFTAKKQPDGSFFLDCGNLGECYLEPDDPGDVVDNIYLTFQTKVDATDDLVKALAAQKIFDYLDIAYSGITNAGGSMYYLASYDGAFAALIIESADETSYIKFVGTTTIDENGLQSVKDSEKDYTFGFIAKEQEDGSYFLDCGEFGECYLEPDDTANILEYIGITFEEMEDVTDEFMAEYGR